MQIYEKYRKDYVKALALFKEERARFVNELGKIAGLRVIPTQANYVMVELVADMTARELTKTLLIKYNLFVKDLSGKVQAGEYLRFAVRNSEDNDKLICALKEEL